MSLFWWLVGLIVAGGIIFYTVMFRGDVEGDMDRDELRTAVDHEFGEEINDVEPGEFETGSGETPNVEGEYEEEGEQLEDDGIARGLRNDVGGVDEDIDMEADEEFAPSLRTETETEKLEEYGDEYDEYDQIDDEGVARGLRSDVGTVDNEYHEEDNEIEAGVGVGDFADEAEDEEYHDLHLTEAAVRARLIDEGFESDDVDAFAEIYGEHNKDEHEEEY